MNLILIFLLIQTIRCSVDWNYEELGPDTWKVNTKYPTCGSGQKQSPINIISSAVAYDSSLAPINFNNYSQTITWNISNNGHTIVGYKNDANPVPSISGSNYGKTFSLLQFHLHWGYNNYQGIFKGKNLYYICSVFTEWKSKHLGSEHLIDNVKFPLELHMVHQASDGSYAVIGFLFQLSASDNTYLTSFINSAIYNSVENRSISANINLGSIFPNSSVLSKIGYFRYAGSLTTPPCTEGIIWTVYNYKINISASQLLAFRNNSVLSNFRDTQQLYSRLVYYSLSGSNLNRLNLLILIFLQIFYFKLI